MLLALIGQRAKLEDLLEKTLEPGLLKLNEHMRRMLAGGIDPSPSLIAQKRIYDHRVSDANEHLTFLTSRIAQFESLEFQINAAQIYIESARALLQASRAMPSSEEMDDAGDQYDEALESVKDVTHILQSTMKKSMRQTQLELEHQVPIELTDEELRDLAAIGPSMEEHASRRPIEERTPAATTTPRRPVKMTH